ncbi:hypothetical protein FDU21_14395 [Xanthomonas oryzae pv. oryzae]|nr:hypothetical protein FDU21_14395 [Xanthomonas oryzae pv. oryzae]
MQQGWITHQVLLPIGTKPEHAPSIAAVRWGARRAHNRSGRGIHTDSEHRPRPPGGERSRFVSRAYGPS